MKIRKTEGVTISAKVREEELLQRKALNNFIRNLEIGAPIVYEGFKLFPVFRDKPENVLDLLTLDKALNENLIKIKDTEVVNKIFDKGEDNRIEFISKADKPIILIEGQTINYYRGYYSYAINKTTILEPQKSIKISTCYFKNFDNEETVSAIDWMLPASWLDTSKDSKSALVWFIDCSNIYMYRYIKKNKPMSHIKNETKGIWELFKQSEEAKTVNTVTSKILELQYFYKNNTERIEKIYEKIKSHIPVSEDIIGFVALIGKKLFADLSYDKSILKSRIKLLLHAYIADALLCENPVAEISEEKIAEIFDHIDCDNVQVKESVSKYGKDLELVTTNSILSAYSTNEEIVHLALNADV